MEHVSTALRSTTRGDLDKRLTGRFYTPPSVCERVVTAALGYEPSIIGDPFCGDGRFIETWLRQAGPVRARTVRKIVLWDFDPEAVEIARQRVSDVLREFGLATDVIDGRAGDTFEIVKERLQSIDLVLTNPPWELLKPDSRDSIADEDAFKGQLRDYAARLAAAYPGAASAKGKAMTGYGVNLARAGAVASVLLTRTGGRLGIVLPSSIFSDQASAPFRREFFSRVAVAELECFPAEAKMFNGVDQPFVTVSAVAGRRSAELRVRRFGPDLTELETRVIDVKVDLARPLPITVGGPQAEIVAGLMQEHPPLLHLEENLRFGLRLGRELDETRLSESFTEGTDGIPFLKGRNVFPYRVERPLLQRVDPKKRAIPKTTRETRLAWRDVSRPNQRRRMHVALVPDGDVTGNSLGIAFFRCGPPSRIRLLLAVMNSFVFELQVRFNLGTAHVSQGILRKCAVPMEAFEASPLAEMLLGSVEEHLRSGRMEAPMLEVCVAKAYGLDRDDFAAVLDAFPKISEIERRNFLRRELW